MSQLGVSQWRRGRAVLAVSVAMVLSATLISFSAPHASAEEYLDIDVFTEVPDPGHPEGIVVAPDGTVYVGTHQSVLEPPNPPSRVFAFAPDGELVDEFEIEGQDPAKGSGILGMATDADGILYIVDRYPQRVIALDPRTGDQWDYATFRQVRELCVPAPGTVLVTDCAFADDLAFAADGTLYVTDVGQNLIWRVPPGGGEAEVWYTNTRLEGPAGPNGIEVMADGRTLMFAQTLTGPLDTLANGLNGEPTLPATGKLFTLSVNADGSPGELTTFWESDPGIGLDGLAIAESGNVYVALGIGANAVAAIAPDGTEIARSPGSEVENKLRDVPLDTPGNLKFLGERLLVTNHAPFAATPSAFVVFDFYVGESGLDPFTPQIPRS